MATQSLRRRHFARAVKAPCDVVVFVDRRGLGIPPEGGGVVALLDSTSEAVANIGQRVAESLQAQLLSLTPEALPPDAAVSVIAVQPPWNEKDEFGAVATAVAARAECPVLVVRPTPLRAATTARVI